MIWTAIYLLLFGIVMSFSSFANIPVMEGKTDIAIVTPENAEKVEVVPDSGSNGSSDVIDMGFKYSMYTEAGYNEKIWNEFYSKYPEYANIEGNALREGLIKEFIPYYSMTMSDFEEGNIFGAWEFTEPDISGENLISRGVYAYGRLRGESQDRWHRMSEIEITPYYASFSRHNLRAEVVNGNVLRIHIDISASDGSGGTFGYVTYQLSSRKDRNSYVGGLKYPWVVIKEKPRATVGTLTTISFATNPSSSSSDRTMSFRGYWDLSGTDLEEFKKYCVNDELGRGAGLLERDTYSISADVVKCTDLYTSMSRASCTHSTKRYEMIPGDDEKHKVYCKICGLNTGTEPHGSRTADSKCSKCSYQFAVSGTAICQFNGYTKEIPYSIKPGDYFIPAQVSGYITPQKVLIPQTGGNINIKYTPISYTLVSGDFRKSLNYDDTYIVEEIKKKGMRHQGFLVR